MARRSKVAQALHYIHSHWRDGKTLKEVAKLFHLDPGNLDRIFRNQEGITVKRFVDQRRREYVLSRLRRKTVLGYVLGAELGFADDLAFYRWVKRVFKVSYVKLRSRHLVKRRRKVVAKRSLAVGRSLTVTARSATRKRNKK